MYGTGQWGQGVPGVVRQGGYTGWGTTQRLYIGIARAQPVLNQAHRVPQGTPGPSRTLRTPWTPAPQHALLEPIWARFSSIYPKVSINLGVSPKSAHEACHSPYLKKAVHKARP